MIFFIPSKKHQDQVLPPNLNLKLQQVVKKAFDVKNNQVNKNSKKRKILADKWVLYGLKWSPYENSPKNSMGVTNYAGTSVPVENEFKKSINHALNVFRIPLADLFIRQKMVMDLLVQSPFSEAGLAVAVGKNYASSSHVDDDIGFTFAYVPYYSCTSFLTILTLQGVFSIL